MSAYTAISAVSETLQTLLEEHITDTTDPQLAGVVIDLRPPQDVEIGNGPATISLWLYRVTRDPYTLNRQPERVAFDQVRPHPLPISLSYLVTPIATDPGAQQVLLGRVLQTFNDHATLGGSDLRHDLAAESGEFRLTLEMLSLEEVTRIWDALKEPYQLSMCYTVQVVSIDSDHEPIETAPVLSKVTRYARVLETH